MPARPSWWLRCLVALAFLAGAPATAQPSELRSASEEDEWLVDQEIGESYRVAPVPRIEGTYEFTDEDQSEVRLRFGLVARVERFDEDTIWIRVYQSTRQEPARQSPSIRSSATAPEEKSLPRTRGRLGWTAADTGLPQSGLWREGLDFGDFDRDGTLDLVLPPARKSPNGARPIVYLRRDERWVPWDGVSFPEQTYDYGDVAVLDFDEDGRLDLAFGMHLLGVHLFRGTADGFERVSGFPPEGPFEARSVAAVEWGGETVLVAFGEGMVAGRTRSGTDSSATANRGLMAWRFQQGGARSLERSGSGELHYGFGDEIAFGRPDGDVLVLALGSRRATARELLVRRVDGAEGGGLVADALPLHHERAFHGAVAFADTDGDGRDALFFGVQETVQGQRWTHLDVYRLESAEAGARWMGETLLSTPSDSAYWSMAGGDLNGDGRDDVVLGTGDGRLEVLLADEDGRLRQDLSPGMPDPRAGCVVREIAIREGPDRSVEVFALFAGEPSRDRFGQPTPGMGCVRGGRVAVWKVTPIVTAGQ